MKITILNGNPDTKNSEFEGYLKKLSDALVSDNHGVTIFNLREMDIRYCIGCFGCWIKTPGECTVKDDSQVIRRQCIGSGLVLFASPIIMGFTSALLKKAQDKLIPLVHPYFELVQGEVHHIKRYDNYPLIGLLLEKGENADEEDVKIISDICRRNSINFKTAFCFTRLTSDPVEEVVDEISRL